MTVLLFANSHASITSLKSSLLTALTSINPNTLPPSLTTLPSDPEDLILGVPIDGCDLRKGWVKLVIPEAKTKSKRPGGRSTLNATVHAAGLKDGNILAFRLRSEREKAREKARRSTDGMEGEEEDILEAGDIQDEQEGDGGEGEEWDVVYPKYDDEASQA
ncbi:hypothetical protein GP486_008483 [Trichoglossum hirsutum]|uniref:Uncharacterized protein n=1 Tax=Trichoglossum hirsutum TaxID=265104 RepID=A0A9P8IC80_9PEZI|nr:hypothetical protein GP486_008483 [Trichoglossum hirsutum]